MKRVIFLLLFLLLLLPSVSFAGGIYISSGKSVAYEDLPAVLRERFEAEKASAIANVRARAPGQSLLWAEARGDSGGYSGSREDNSLRVEYKIYDSVIAVGEYLEFDVNLSCLYPPMDFAISWIAFNEQFDEIGGYDFTSDVEYDGGTSAFVPGGFTLVEPGYISLFVVALDGNGNLVSLTSSTVRVYEKDEPLFDNMAIDNDLIMMMNLNRSSMKVGDVITATVEYSTNTDPLEYSGAWTLRDENGNVLHTSEFYERDLFLENEKVKREFQYQPLQAGILQMKIDVYDGAGNIINSNTPFITVQDGFHFTAQLNRKLYVQAGNELTATYEIHGHECSDCRYFCGWICYDEVDGKALVTKTETLKARSGKVKYTPRIGKEIVFYVGASCNSVPSAYPVECELPIVDGLLVDMTLDASTVAYGNPISMTYSAEGGKTPYSQIVISGYTYDKSRDRTYQFMTRTLTDASGTVSGYPKLGDEVYFTLQLAESDGNITTWQSGKATLTGAPEVTDPKLTASLDASEVAVGKPITVTYEMTGGSDTINKTEDGVSYVSWKKADGTVVSKVTLTDDDGTQSFIPTEPGSYYCELVLTDAYRQQVSWKSDVFTAVANLPGDADSDGDVDVHDAMLVLKYCAGWAVSPNRDNADVDGSGSVNMADAVRIIRYCTGEDVTLE